MMPCGTNHGFGLKLSYDCGCHSECALVDPKLHRPQCQRAGSKVTLDPFDLLECTPSALVLEILGEKMYLDVFLQIGCIGTRAPFRLVGRTKHDSLQAEVPVTSARPAKLMAGGGWGSEGRLDHLWRTAASLK